MARENEVQIIDGTPHVIFNGEPRHFTSAEDLLRQQSKIEDEALSAYSFMQSPRITKSYPGAQRHTNGLSAHKD